MAYTLKAGNEKRANEIFSLLIYVLIGLGAVFTIGGIAFLTPMSRLPGADETMLPVCVSYGRIVLLGLIPYMLQIFSSRRRHTGLVSDWSSDVCSSDLNQLHIQKFLSANCFGDYQTRQIGRASCRERV